MNVQLDDDNEVPSRRLRLAGLIVLVLAVGFGSWVVVRRLTTSEQGSTAPTDTVGISLAGASDSPDVAITSAVPSSSAAPAAPSTSLPVDSSIPGTASTAAITTSADYETLPDGSALPIAAIFDGSVVTLRGTVPDAASAGRLEQWAKDNARDPNVVVRNELDVNPGAPRDVDVRFLELQSTQFPLGGAELQPEHEPDLSRVVSMLNERSTVSVIVVGHADQPGADAFNVVAAERARSVASYLAASGIAPTRLASRGAGLDDFRTLDDAVLASLSGRVEFVLRGLLIS